MILMAIGLTLIAIGLIVMLLPEGRTDETNEEYVQKEYTKKENAGRTKVQGGAIVMIGPIPIVVGSDYRMTLIIMLMAIAVMIIWVLAFKI